MDRQKLIEKLTELELTKDELNEKLTKVCEQIIKTKHKIQGSLRELCFTKHQYGIAYYRIIEDRGDTVDCIYCCPEEKCVTLFTYQEKLDFVNSSMNEITREEFDKVLEKTYNNLKEL